MFENRLIVMSLICTLLIAFTISTPNTIKIELTQSITPAGLEFSELVSDPELSEAPTIVISEITSIRI